jgi:hypothetical protein
VYFGCFAYDSSFFVLKEDIPNILGITFFREAEPRIDWTKNQVWKGKISLPV